MGMRMVAFCAYCGEPLQLIAGFCSVCHAPTAVAMKERLIADARRRAGQVLTFHTDVSHVIKPSKHSSAIAFTRDRSSRWTRPLALLSVVSLGLAVVFIVLHVLDTANTHAFWRSPSLLSVTQSSHQENAITTVRVGQTFSVNYVLLIEKDWSDVTLSITPNHAPARNLVERWPRGQVKRSFSLTPAEVGHWIIALVVDGKTLQSLMLTVFP
jgi:hypothetical protein